MNTLVVGLTGELEARCQSLKKIVRVVLRIMIITFDDKHIYVPVHACMYVSVALSCMVRDVHKDVR